MTNDTWSIINAGIASVAAIAGVAATWVGILVYRKQADGEFPTVSVTFDGPVLVFRVENITGIEWTIDSIELPSRTKGNLEDKLSDVDHYGDLIPLSPSEMSSKMLAGKVPVGYHLYPSGTAQSASMTGRADMRRVRMHVQTSRPSISTRLILLSCEARQRKKVIEVTRDVPASVRMEID